MRTLREVPTHWHGCIVSCSVVEYASYSDLKNALRKLDGAELNGRRIRLYEDSRSRRRR